MRTKRKYILIVLALLFVAILGETIYLVGELLQEYGPIKIKFKSSDEPVKVEQVYKKDQFYTLTVFSEPR